MRLLDLFCGAGGAAVGYHRAGFDVVGVDIEPQPNYPFPFVQADALHFLSWGIEAAGFDAIHASPPCQMFSAYRRAMPERGDEHYVNLIPPTRELLRITGLPYVIENVEGAPLENPIRLCGTGFGLHVQRHRLFESNVSMMSLGCSHGRNPAQYDRGSRHIRPNNRRTVAIGEWRIPLELQQQAMGIDWMTMAELSQAIPPAYTEHIGRYLMAAIERKDDPMEPQEMPYKRNGCDLCGRVAPLSRIELAAGNREKLARVAYVCDQHQAPFVALGPPHSAENKQAWTKDGVHVLQDPLF